MILILRSSGDCIKILTKHNLCNLFIQAHALEYFNATGNSLYNSGGHILAKVILHLAI